MKNYLAILGLAGALLGGPVTEAAKFNKEYGFGFDVSLYNTDGLEPLVTLPPHPNDWFLTGVTTADDLKWYGLRPYAEIIIGPKTKRFGLNFGLRVGTNLGSKEELERETNFTEPVPTAESYVFSRVRPEGYNIVPFLSARINATEGIGIEGGISFPYTGFDLKAGHDRFNRQTVEQEYSWDGFGQGFFLGVKGNMKKSWSRRLRDHATDPNSKWDWCLTYRREVYNTNFNEEQSQIETDNIGVDFRREF